MSDEHEHDDEGDPVATEEQREDEEQRDSTSKEGDNIQRGTGESREGQHHKQGGESESQNEGYACEHRDEHNSNLQSRELSKDQICMIGVDLKGFEASSCMTIDPIKADESGKSKIVSNEDKQQRSADQYEAHSLYNAVPVRNRSRKKFESRATKCYSQKIYRPRTDVEAFNEFNKLEKLNLVSVLNDVKQIDSQWSTSKMSWEIVPQLNPRSMLDLETLTKINEGAENSDSVSQDLFIRSFGVCYNYCYMFRDLLKMVNREVEDYLDFENKFCELVVQLMTRVEVQYRSDVISSLNRSLLNMQADDISYNDEKRKAMLIRTKPGNGLEFTCMILEQVIVDNIEVDSCLGCVWFVMSSLIWL